MFPVNHHPSYIKTIYSIIIINNKHTNIFYNIVPDRIYTFCNDNNLINKKQGGFRPKHSTISSTAFYIDDLYNAMKNNQVTISVYIDAMIYYLKN